jgi:hypothetical protein
MQLKSAFMNEVKIKVIRNENEVEKAKHGQYQRYPSDSIAQVSTDWLKRKGNAKEVTFLFFLERQKLRGQGSKNQK